MRQLLSSQRRNLNNLSHSLIWRQLSCFQLSIQILLRIPLSSISKTTKLSIPLRKTNIRLSSTSNQLTKKVFKALLESVSEFSKLKKKNMSLSLPRLVEMRTPISNTSVNLRTPPSENWMTLTSSMPLNEKPLASLLLYFEYKKYWKNQMKHSSK